MHNSSDTYVDRYCSRNPLLPLNRYT